MLEEMSLYIYKDVMIVGFDKIRKHQMSGLEEKFSKLDSLAKKHNGHIEF